MIDSQDSHARATFGNELYAAGDYSNALEAYRAALALNISLLECWPRYVDCLRRIGRPDLAADAERSAQQIKALPVAVLGAHDDLARGNIDRAETTIRAFLQSQGIHVEGMRVMALIMIRRDILDVAEELLAQVVKRAPNHFSARAEYVTVLNRLQKYPEALPHIELAVRTYPDSRDYRLLHAHTLAGLNRYHEVIDTHSLLLPAATDPVPHHLAMGHAHRGLGLMQQAVADYRQAIATRPAAGEAWWSLANLKVYRFSVEDENALLNALATAELADEDRIGLHFAYAKALEDRQQFAGAMQHYAEGNAQQARRMPYRPVPLDRIVAQSKALFTSDFFAQRRGWGHPDAAPIFIVGLPRSGSTLVEQILASHPAIDGTMELPQINQLINSLCSARQPGQGLMPYPGVVATLDADTFAALGQRYIDRTRSFRSDRRCFTDKMGENFLYLGLIRLMLPRARIIDVRREPMACCFSNYKQLFASGQEFSYDFEALAHLYTRYLAIMHHWDVVLPGQIYRLQHERLVWNFADEVRSLLDFLALPFDARCLNFHDSAHRARTASSEQVRRPINAEGIGQWRHFAPDLTALRQHLYREAQDAGVGDVLSTCISR